MEPQDHTEFGNSIAAERIAEYLAENPNKALKKRVQRTLSSWSCTLKAAASIPLPTHNGPNCRATLMKLTLEHIKQTIGNDTKFPEVISRGITSILAAKYRILLGITKPK